MRTLWLLLVCVACSKDNPYYCADHPDHNCTIDASGTTACTSPDDCTDPATPVCDTASKICVPCTPTMPGACSGTAPVCSMANTCTGCTANEQCASGACMPDGSCADAASALYVSPTGSETGSCTSGEKCSLGHALTIADATKKLIVLDPGSHSVASTLSIAKDITLLGHGAEIVKGGTVDGPVIAISAGAQVTIYYATIKRGLNNAGVTCANATLVARYVSLVRNDGSGLSAMACNVTVDRSTIWDNHGGGISIAGASPPFTLTNNFIYANGDPNGSLFGGVQIAVATPANSRFEFNTIVKNSAVNVASYSGGVSCNSLMAPNNIVAGNLVGTSASATNSQTVGDCSYPTSRVQPDLADLAFVNATVTPFDLHIGENSTARDGATTASPIEIDWDGDSRAIGVKDIGADEYK